MRQLPHSAVGSRLPSTYRPPGTSSVAPANGLPGQSYRQVGNRIAESRAAQQTYTPPRATGTYKAPPTRPPATYTRGGIPFDSYSHPDPFVQMPTYGGKYDPVVYNSPNPRQLPRPAIKPRPSPAPVAKGARVPRGVGGSAVAGGAVAGIGGAVTAGIVLSQGGSVPEAVGAGVGSAVGSVAGGVAGAAIGAALGPVGAAVGGAVGSAVGGWVGAEVGGAIGDWIDGEDIPTESITGNPPAPGAGDPITPTQWINSFPDGTKVDLSPWGGIEFRIKHTGGFIVSRNCSAIKWAPNPNNTTYPYKLSTYSCSDVEVQWNMESKDDLTAETIGVCGASGELPTVPRNLNRPVVFGQPSPTAPPLPEPPTLPNQRPPIPSSLPPTETTPEPIPEPITQTETAPIATSQNTPDQAPAPTGATVPATGTLTQPKRFQTPDGEVTIEASPENPQKYEIQPDGSIQTTPISPEEIPQWDYIPDWLKEELQRRSEADTIPELLPAAGAAVGAATALTPIPTASTKLRTLPGPATAITDPTTNGIRPPASPPKQFPSSTAGNCGCNVPIIANQKKIISMINSSTGTPTPSNATPPPVSPAAEAVSLAAIMQKLNAMQAFAAKAWEATRIQKVLDVLTFVAVMHNVALLSRDVGETFGWVAGQALNVVGIEDEEGNTIDVYGWFTNGIQSLLVSLFGQELYDDARETWLKASSIVRSASMIIWTMRGIMDATQDLMEWVAENTGKIGNALKRFGVVGERAYPWMSERAQARNRIRARFDKVTGTLENAEDVASSFSMATGNILEIQQETGELEQQFADFRTTVLDAVPDPWDDNQPVVTETQTENTASQSPDIQSSDTGRG